MVAKTVSVRWLTSGVYQVGCEVVEMQTFIGARGETLDVPADIAAGMIAAGMVELVAGVSAAPVKKRRRSA